MGERVLMSSDGSEGEGAGGAGEGGAAPAPSSPRVRAPPPGLPPRPPETVGESAARAARNGGEL